MSDEYTPRRGGARLKEAPEPERPRSNAPRRPRNKQPRYTGVYRMILPYLPGNINARKAIHSAVLVVLLLAFTAVFKGCSAKQAAEEVPVDTAPVETAEPAPSYTNAVLGFSGDFVGHKAVSDSGLQDDGSYDFTEDFEYAETAFEGIDYLMCNLETTLSATEVTGNPTFASPDDLAYWLKDFGFDMVTTANNHCLDKGFEGLQHTIETLNTVGLDHVGTYASQEDYDANHGVLVSDVNGISIAFLDYTYGTNYNTVDNSWEVNVYNTDPGEFDVTLDTDKFDADMEYARGLNTDLIIVCMHWGLEYETAENEMQDEAAEYLIARGADAIVGGHAHVAQPFKYVTTTDAETGESVTGFVCYSLGNLISNQHDELTNLTAVLRLSIQKDNNSGETTITDVAYTPLYLLNRGEDMSHRYVLMDTLYNIDQYDSGSGNPYIDDDVYSAMKESLTQLQDIFGSEWTAMSPGLTDTAEETPAESEAASSETPSETGAASTEAPTV